jgi:hypothetical protein
MRKGAVLVHASGSRVAGIRARAIANRQLAIYDKRAEIIQQGKMGWVTIWDAALAAQGKSPLDLTDRNSSQVWRFELRLGSKQLRNRFEMRNWQDIRDMIGNDLRANCCGVLPNDVRDANRTEKMREINRQLLGLFVTRAAISEVTGDDFHAFM